MSLITPQPAASELEGILKHRPELLEKYRTFYLSFWHDGLVPRRVLELCRRRVAHIQGCEAELALSDPQTRLSPAEETALAQGDFASFSAAEQSALVLAESMPNGVHYISDEEVKRAARELGEPACVALLTALSFMDVNCRLKIVLGADVAPGSLHDDILN